MKKFWTLLALLAMALNFSSASLWAEEIKAEGVSVAGTEEAAKESGDKEVALEAAAVATDEATPVVAKSAAPATLEEEKKDEMGSALPDTTQAEDKVS